MKQLILILSVIFLIPLGSHAQFIAYQGNKNVLSQNDPSFNSFVTGGKKKKSASKKDQLKDKKTAKKAAKTTDYSVTLYGGGDLAFGFPLGKIRDSVNNGMGLNLRAEYVYSPIIHLGLWTGYKSYRYDRLIGEGHFSYIPVKLTASYYFGEGTIRPYANLGLGVYMVNQKYDADFYTLVRNPQTNRLDTLYEKKHLKENQTKFGFSPSLGVLYNVQDQYYINFNMSYEMILTEKKPASFMGINIGLLYKFGF